MEEVQGIRKVVTRTPIEVSRVYKADFQKENTLTAELKQLMTVKSYYPAQTVISDMQDNPFSIAEFGFKETEYVDTKKRVAWINVPINATIDSVKAVFASKPATNLYQVLANRPILTDRQLAAISNPEIDLTKDQIAMRQVVRFGTGHEKEGQIILDNNGKPMYRAVFYHSIAKEDIDQRTSDPADFYAPQELLSELEGVVMIIEEQTM